MRRGISNPPVIGPGFVMLGCSVAVHAQCDWQVELIGPEPDCGVFTSAILPRAISDTGVVVGYWKCAVSSIDHPFIWDQVNELITIALPEGFASGRAHEIADDGTVVGVMGGVITSARGFMYRDGLVTELPPLPGENYSEAFGVAGDMVVGVSAPTLSSGDRRAVVWQDEIPTALALPIGPESEATAINDQLEIAGWMGQAPSAYAHGFLLSARGEVTDLGFLPGTMTTEPKAMNTLAEVVGRAFIPGGDNGTFKRAFHWQDGVITDLGFLPGYFDNLVQDISDNGTIVGFCQGTEQGGSEQAPYAIIDGGMIAIETLLPADFPFVLKHAWAVNNSDQIALVVGASKTAVITPPSPTDLDGDCQTGVEDLLILLGEWGASNSPADFDNSGSVDVIDLLFLLGNWS